MKPSKTRVIFVIISLVCFQFPALTQDKISSAKAWQLMATSEVDYILDFVSFELDSTSNPYTSIKLKVKEGELNIYKCTVYFIDGFRQETELSKYLENGNDGKIINLLGNQKAINRIQIKFDPKEKIEDKSVVEIWGKI